MKRRVKLKPSRASSILGLCMGALMCVIGLFFAVPTFGLVGILWTVMAACITAYAAMPLFREDGSDGRTVIIEDEDDPAGDAEQRLRSLQDLLDKGLITREESDQKRRDVIDKL